MIEDIDIGKIANILFTETPVVILSAPYLFLKGIGLVYQHDMDQGLDRMNLLNGNMTMEEFRMLEIQRERKFNKEMKDAYHRFRNLIY